jgi:hypothetical protein
MMPRPFGLAQATGEVEESRRTVPCAVCGAAVRRDLYPGDPMKTILVASLLAFASLSAAAEDKKAAAPAGGMDMSKAGPWTRKTDDAKVKKEVLAFLAKAGEVEKKGDMHGQMDMVDFPVYMASDAAGGKIDAGEWNKEKWEQVMKPFFENSPKDMKVTHKWNVTVLSDSLANVTDDFTMTMGKQKMSGRNMSLLVKRNGDWKWKVMAEPGWAGMDGDQQAQK